MDDTTRIEDKIDAIKSQTDSTYYQVKYVGERIDRVEKLLTGNGDPEKGFIVKLDRLIQTVGVQKKFFWMLVAAVVTGAVYLGTH